MIESGRFGTRSGRCVLRVLLWLVLCLTVAGCGSSGSSSGDGTAGSNGSGGSGGSGVDVGGASAGGYGASDTGGAGGSAARGGTGGDGTGGDGTGGDGNAGAASGGPTTITGVFSYASNPCFTDPCLPGMAASVTVGTDRYVLRVAGRMPSGEYDWQNWDGYVPQPDETVTVLGYLTTAQDIYGSTVLIFQVVQITAS
jgi:hypothetical protein